MDISSLILSHRTEPKLVEKIIDDRFENLPLVRSAYENSSIANYYNKKPELVGKYVNMKEGEFARFRGEEIKYLLLIEKRYSDKTNKLLNLLGKDNKYRFSGYDIYRIAPIYEQESKITEKVLQMEDGKGGYRFGFDIPEVVQVLKQE